MTFARANILGWALYEVLTSAQMNAVDLDHSRALDGFAGGAYAPSADITFASTNSIEWGAGKYPKLSSRTLRRVQPTSLIKASNFIGGGAFDFAHGSLGVLTQDYVDGTGTNDPFVILGVPNLIDLATMTAIGVIIDPVSGSPPTEPPKLFILKFPSNAGGTTVGSETADPTSGGSYAAIHGFSVSGLTEAIDESASPNATYKVRFKGESGSGSNVGLVVMQLWADFTTTLCTPGG